MGEGLEPGAVTARSRRSRGTRRGRSSPGRPRPPPGSRAAAASSPRGTTRPATWRRRRPFDRPRIRLLCGEHLRRLGRRVDARENLRAALDGFEEIGAEPWAERTRGELRASGETARRRGPDVASTLTPQERQIAAMVGQGLTNKEVAAQLYLSPRTIDAHMRNVFAKLGISSRRELRDLARGPATAPVGG